MDTDNQTKENQSTAVASAFINEMAKSGVYIGRLRHQSHPKIKSFLFGSRNDLQIINLEKTAEKLESALEFLRGIAKNKGVILFVGTKMPAKLLIKEAAAKCGMPYVDERWLGGTLTNINTILKRIEHYLDLEKRKSSGDLATKYTKKEQAKFERELNGLAKNLEGIRNLKKMPETLFIVDGAAHDWAVKEAVKMKIPIVAIVNTDFDPTRVAHPIPANSESLSSVKLILDKAVEAIVSVK